MKGGRARLRVLPWIVLSIPRNYIGGIKSKDQGGEN